MPIYNAELYVAEAIESALGQSFDNFEFIIIDGGSTDRTLSIIRAFKDNRIKLIVNKCNFGDSLNLGISNAKGKYIARMNADDIMHVDRLRIQYAIMEDEKDITVCGTWVTPIGKNILLPDVIGNNRCGLIENPLMTFLCGGNYIFHSTIMMRAEFLKKHGLKYENYFYSEDFKLWSEIAKLGGRFYIDNQPLLYYRLSDTPITEEKNKKRRNSSDCIIQEIIEYLIDQNEIKYSGLLVTLSALNELKQKKLMSSYDVSIFFQNLFLKNKNKLRQS